MVNHPDSWPDTERVGDELKAAKAFPFGLCAFVLLAIFLVASPTLTPAWGATYYVASAGSDINPGTQAAPFRTIQKAADIVNPGDTVLVADGTYTDTDGNGVVVYVRRGGTSGNWITFGSQNKWGAKVDTQTGAHGWYVSAQYIIIQDFEITGGTNNNAADGIAAGASYLQVIGNHIHDVGRACMDTAYGNDGIFTDNGVNHVTIERNIIHDIGRYAAGEHGCNPSNAYYQNHDHGLYLDGGSDYTIRNNIFYNCNRGWAIHIYPNPSDHIYIYNNTFAFPNPWRSSHIILTGNLSYIDIANNISYTPTAGFISYYDGGVTLSNSQARNNLTYGGTINANPPVSGIAFSGNLDNTDPKLVNPATFNFHPQSGSPAIDAGVTLIEVTTDFDGITRPQGSAYDIGAYEYVSVAPPDTTPPAAPKGLRVK